MLPYPVSKAVDGSQPYTHPKQRTKQVTHNGVPCCRRPFSGDGTEGLGQMGQHDVQHESRKRGDVMSEGDPEMSYFMLPWMSPCCAVGATCRSHECICICICICIVRTLRLVMVCLALPKLQRDLTISRLSCWQQFTNGSGSS